MKCCEEEWAVPKAQSFEEKQVKDQKRKENQSLQNFSEMKREFVGGTLRKTVADLPKKEKEELQEIFADNLKNPWGGKGAFQKDDCFLNILIWEHNHNEIFNAIKKYRPELIESFNTLTNKSEILIPSKIEEVVT